LAFSHQQEDMMSKSNLSRRTLVSSAVALPALAVPAVALPAATPSSTPQTQTELLVLGEQLKPLLAEIHRLTPKHRKLYREADAVAGDPPRSLDEIQERNARFGAMAKKNGHYELCDQLNPINDEAWRIAKRILKIESTDRIGDGIRAAAALVLDEPSYMDREAGTVLWQMAARAGFSVPADQTKKLRRIAKLRSAPVA
jgi:hypothetical protein